MVRAPCFDSNGMKKGAWSEEEDNKLRAFVEINGHLNWRLVPKYAGLARCGKSCRLRWMNYLKPGVRRGNFSKQEEDLIIKLHAQLGNKWSVIATKLPGRTDNDIKNYYHSRIEKRRGQNRAAKKVIVHASDASSKLDDQVMEEEKASAFTLSCKTTQNEIASSDANSLITLQQSTLLFDANPSILPITKLQVNLWPDRLLADTNCNQNDYFPTLTFEDELFNPVLHYSKLSSSDDSSYDRIS